MFTLAMVQMRVEGGDRAANLARASARIAEAADQGADLALLPETMDLGWTHSSARQEASPAPGGETFEALRRAARQSRIFVCAGLVERDGDRVYNAAVLVDPEGELLLKHRKLNELEIGHACYDQGDRLGVCHTRLGTFGLHICADAFASGHALSRALGYMGAEMILSPSAWAVPPDYDNAVKPYEESWHGCYKPVARDFSLWIAGVSNVGPVVDGAWSGWNCIGCSLLIDPDGNEVARGPYGVDAEAILYAEVALRPRPTRGAGWSQRPISG